MKIKVTITFKKKDQDWPTLLTQNFESWQRAFKESQKLINKFVWVKDATLLNIIFEEVS